MGADTACLDLALGFAGRARGLIASGAGLEVLFFASTPAGLCAVAVAMWLLDAPSLA